MRHDSRGRITLPDILFILVSLGMLAAVWPVFMSLFEANQHVVPTGAGLMYQMLLPMAILVLLSIIYVKAIRGMRL